MSKEILEQIKCIRSAEGLTQRDLSKKLGVGEVSIARYETGTRIPNIEVMKKLCAAFPHYMWYLMQESMDDAPDGQITPEEKILRGRPNNT